MKIFRIIRAALCVVTVSMLLVGISAEGEGSPAYIDLAFVSKNASGEGYYWNNIEDTLTIDGLDVSTNLDYGLRLPEKCTVIVNGRNRIEAGKYGIGCFSDVTFKGDGELTIVAGDTAIYEYSENTNHKILIRGGTYNLKGGQYGLLSTSASVSLTDGSLTIEAGECAVSAPILNIVGGQITSDSPLYALHRLDVSGAALDIHADSAALRSDGSINADQVEMYVGEDGERADEYGGENVLKTVPALEDRRGSILFGKDVSGVYDWLTLAAALILLSAVIAVPIVRKRIRTKRLYERLEAEGAVSTAERRGTPSDGGRK